MLSWRICDGWRRVNSSALLTLDILFGLRNNFSSLLPSIAVHGRDRVDTLFRVEMLGLLLMRQGRQEIRRFRTQKTAELLAYMAFYKQRSHPRDLLIELYWPDSTLEAARSNLSVALTALRRQLEAPGTPSGTILVADRSQVHLNPLAFTSDVENFDTLLEEAKSKADERQRLELQIRALDLYRGDLLPGFYSDWIFAERSRLRDSYLSTLRQVIKTYAEARQYERALQFTHRMVQADPLREGSYHDLMRLYQIVGRPEDALSQYEALEILLQKEFQTAPSAPLRALAATLRQAASSRLPVARAIADRPGSMPSNIQRSPSNDTLPLCRIPPQFTRFFGRDAELADLTARLDLQAGEEGGNDDEEILEACGLTTDTSRLVTLTGPGGMGKTRLSIEVVGRVSKKYLGGVWFVPLAELRDPFHLGEALRDALELPRQTQSPVLEQVIGFLNGRGEPCLLLLDNFEQISAGGAPIVWTLLSRVPTLRCLVTSRQPLALPGEREIPVLPLPTSAAETSAADSALLTARLLTCPSIALFVDRAQMVRPEFQITLHNAGAITALCEKLEGIPLAIELAGARAKVLSPPQILNRITERFELLATRRGDKGHRHNSLWAAINWSYHLLPSSLQRFFARLSVFRGGWSLEAAEAVCGEPMALDYLAQLRGHSLLFAEESSITLRFRMLETLREFAAEQLTAEERAALERRHAEYFQQRVMSTDLSGPALTTWQALLEAELDNLRASLLWSLREENALTLGLAMAGNLYFFWRTRGHLSEGRHWYARLLERADSASGMDLARSLYGAGALANLQGDFAAARPLLQRCLALFQTLEEKSYQGNAHNELGVLFYRNGDYPPARVHFEQYLALAREQEQPFHVAKALGNLAILTYSTGDFATARALHAECLEIFRETGDRSAEATTLFNLGNLAHSAEQFEEAEAYYEQSLKIRRELADRVGISSSLAGLATLAKIRGDYATAFHYAREGLTLAKELNARVCLVSLLVIMIGLVQAYGELELTTRMNSALEGIRKQMNYAWRPIEREKQIQDQKELQSALGREVYEAACAAGRNLSLEQALDCLEEALAHRLL